jgi:hypothetical protein
MKHLLTILMGVLPLAGCVDTPVFEVDAPLLVFNTYPANGATIARSDLGELAVTFSAGLGTPEEARAQAAEQLVFTDEATGRSLAFIRGDGTNVAYDADDFTLRVVLDDEARRAVDTGAYVLTVGREFRAEDGRKLPTDYIVRFTVALQ